MPTTSNKWDISNNLIFRDFRWLSELYIAHIEQAVNQNSLTSEKFLGVPHISILFYWTNKTIYEYIFNLALYFLHHKEKI